MLVDLPLLSGTLAAFLAGLGSSRTLDPATAGWDPWVALAVVRKLVAQNYLLLDGGIPPDAPRPIVARLRPTMNMLRPNRSM